MTTLSKAAAAIIVAVVSTLVSADAPEAPERYAAGPFSPRASITSLSVHERIAYALLEGIIQSAEAYVHANGCPTPALDLDLEVYSDTFSNPVVGDATLGLIPDILKLKAEADPSGNFRGQVIAVEQDTDILMQYIHGKQVANFQNTMTYNSANNMMVGHMSVDVVGQYGPSSFSGQVIKDFYNGVDKSGATPAGENELFLIIDWGLQFLSKEGYPIEKYWQRSKVRHSDGGQGKTVFVKDRLVGVTPCRITVDLAGDNGPGIFMQDGTLTIEKVSPDATSDALDAVVSPVI